MRFSLAVALFAAHAGSSSAVRLSDGDGAWMAEDSEAKSPLAEEEELDDGPGAFGGPTKLSTIADPPEFVGEPAWPVSWDSPRGDAFEPAFEAFSAAGLSGEVDFLYTFGAPGGGSPGVKNQKDPNGCFAGLRVWNTLAGRWWGKWVDLAVRITNYVWYGHAKVPTLEVQTGNLEDTWYPVACDENTDPNIVWEPIGELWGTGGLHEQPKYIASMGQLNRTWLHNMTIFASDTAYNKNPDDVRANIIQHGWRLAGSALHPGGWIYGGRQISHLIQSPTTLECVLTFQGTASAQGWVSNFDWMATHFCGLSDEDESCRFRMFGCKTRNPKGSFVHSGFSGRLRVLAKSVEWQHNVHRFLPSCRKVHVAGHSLGGAMAELYSACVSNAPAPGQFGWEDYKWMGWKTGTPTRLPWLL